MSAQDVARMHYDGFNNRTFDKNARNYVDANGVFVDGPTGTEFRGLEGYLNYARGWTVAFPDSKVKITDQKVAGNKVITTFTGQGTFTGQLATPQGMVPGNGRRLSLEFREEMEIQNGKIVHSRTDYDMQEFMRQLGLG